MKMKVQLVIEDEAGGITTTDLVDLERTYSPTLRIRKVKRGTSALGSLMTVGTYWSHSLSVT